MITLPFALWTAAAVLAVYSLVRLCTARRAELEGRLRRWLTDELETLNKKRKILLKVRKQRAELREAEEAAAARAMAAAAEIADLNIGEMFADRQRRDAEAAATAKKMRQRT